MSNPIRTPITALLMLGGAAVALAGIALTFVHGFALGVPIVLAGLIIELGGAWHHDRLHMRRGEQPHALWGRGDHNRPRRLGGPRRVSS